MLSQAYAYNRSHAYWYVTMRYQEILRYAYVYMGKIYARGIMVIVVGNGHDNMSSNPRRDWLHFT